MTQTERIKLLAQAIGADIGAIKTSIGNKTELTTEAKTNLVVAINELVTKIQSIETLQRTSSEIDDSGPRTDRVYSSNKVKELLDDIGELLGTLDASGYADIGTGLKTLKDKVTALEGKSIDLTALIDDADKGADKVWSSNKVFNELDGIKESIDTKIASNIAKVKKEILGENVPEALDTLKELADKLNGDASIVAGITTALNNRVRFDEDQVLTAEQKTKACTNIGIGEPNTDFVEIYTTAKG